MKVSFLMLNIDRYEVMKDTITKNIERVGVDVEIELLFCDNGSTDKRAIEFLDSMNPKYFRKNSSNEGVARAMNQLYLRSTGDLIVLLGNDILLPQGWLKSAMAYAHATPKCGIIGIDWGHGQLPPCTEKFSLNAHWVTPEKNKVFGVWILQRKLIEQIGFFADDFLQYGLEDTNFNERVNRAGFYSFYLPDMKSEHLCNDAGQSSEYRKMKDYYMDKNYYIQLEKMKRIESGDFIEPLPQARDAI